MQNISEELRKQIPKFESGKMYGFQLLGTRYSQSLKRLLVPNSINILPQDVIYDPFTDSEVEIECHDRTLPNGQVILKKIMFRKDEAGKKLLNGSKKGDKSLFEYLWLSNYNAANRDKEWFIEPKGGCKYTFLEPEKSSQEKLDVLKMQHKAQEVVFNLSDKDIKIVCEALANSQADKFNYNPKMLESQMRESLIDFANRNPSRVITLDKELNLEVRNAIRAAKDAGIISYDVKKQEIVWTDTGNRITIIEPGKDAETTLVGYFVTKKGSEVLKTILANLQKKEGKGDNVEA